MTSSTRGADGSTGRAGRRPGNPDTRAQIVDAARSVFGRAGYDATSSRSVAREAGVDPALIHHYFENKAELYMAAFEFPTDPRDIRSKLGDGLPPGEDLVLTFLHLWEDAGPPGAEEQGTNPFIALMQAATAAPEGGAALRGFLEERVWSRRPRLAGDSDETHALRLSLVSSQLFGLGWARHVLRLEPLASAPPEAIAKVAGPTIEQYMTGDVSRFADEVQARAATRDRSTKRTRGRVNTRHTSAKGA